ncbi:choice-of-anchor B family protein [bacterium]|nr:choice-of-anchor B family protein [bacterium]
MRNSNFVLLLLALTLLASNSANGQSGSFGNAFVLQDGELIVSEPNTTFREGSVYVYRKGEDQWILEQRLTAPDSERADGFGSVLARTGATLFIGQRNGPLHVFSKNDGAWQSSGTLSGNGTTGIDPGCNQYGYCGTDFGISLSAAGDWLLVGNAGAIPSRRDLEEGASVSAGVVFVYHKNADGSWTEHSHLSPSSGKAGDRFGETIYFEGDEALIGSPSWNDEIAGLEGVGRVTRFVLDGTTWNESESLSFFSESTANFGSAIEVRGNEALISAPGSNGSRGAVYAYSRSSSNDSWIPTRVIHNVDAESGDRFGSSLGFSSSQLWIGSPTLRQNLTGSTYVYDYPENGALSDDPTRLQLEKTVERDAFGQNLIADSDVVVVSAPGMHHQSGAVYVYSGSSTEAQMLTSPPDALGAILGEMKECEDGKIGPFDCDEVELLSFVPNSILRAPENARGVRTNDNWGWTDPQSGKEYALVGRNDGTSFIDITDPSNPILIGDLPKPWGTPPSQLWRDIKTYKNHAYIVADGAGDHGMQIFDLTRLRDVKDAPALFEPDVHYTDIASSHNVIINEETGFAYTVDGPTCGGGLYMMNIQEPLNPVFVGCSKLGDRGTHDSQCVTYSGPDTRYTGRELCLNSNGSVFEIADVTDKNNPTQISTASSPNAGYIHQGWLTDDHKYFYQDDEADLVRGSVETTRTLVWDLTDLEDPILINEFMGSMPASAHNLYLKDGFAYQANYRYGLHVLDISDPENPVEAGFFDTSPYQDGAGFSGAWSTYPFFESGTVLVTSLQEGLFILKKRTQAF